MGICGVVLWPRSLSTVNGALKRSLILVGQEPVVRRSKRSAVRQSLPMPISFTGLVVPAKRVTRASLAKPSMQQSEGWRALQRLPSVAARSRRAIR